MLATSFAIEELSIPSTVEGPEAADFVEMVRVRNAVESGILGSDALACTPQELLPTYLAQDFEPKRIFVARVDGQLVGRAVLEWSIAEGTSSTWVSAEVLEDFRGRGIGSALFDRVQELALESGRPTLQAEALHTTAPGGKRLAAPTGYGDLPISDPGVRFLTRHGYRLEQIERVSFLSLPTDAAALEQAFTAARAAAGERYALVSWIGRTPPERIEDLLVLHTRMSTDAPFGGLDIDEEPWDEARLANYDDSLATSRQTRLTVAAQDIRTGRLVGFTELAIPENRTRPAHQGDTQVLKEHRGHRLGMLLKAANLRALAAIVPAPPMVCTFNAEENRHMLDVNEAIGFRAVGNAGCWRKHD